MMISWSYQFCDVLRQFMHKCDYQIFSSQGNRLEIIELSVPIWKESRAIWKYFQATTESIWTICSSDSVLTWHYLQKTLESFDGRVKSKCHSVPGNAFEQMEDYLIVSIEFREKSINPFQNNKKKIF